MREIKYRLDLTHNYLKIDAGKEFYLRPNDDNTQKIFMLPQSYTINCRRLLLRETSLTPQWYLDLLYYVDESDTRGDNEIIEDVFKFSTFDVSMDSDNVSSSGETVFVEGVNGTAPWFSGVFEKMDSLVTMFNDLLTSGSNHYDLGSIVSTLGDLGLRITGANHTSLSDIRGLVNIIGGILSRTNRLSEVSPSDFNRYLTFMWQYTFSVLRVYYSPNSSWYLSTSGLWNFYTSKNEVYIFGNLLWSQVSSGRAYPYGRVCIPCHQFYTDSHGQFVVITGDCILGANPIGTELVIRESTNNAWATAISDGKLYMSPVDVWQL